MSTRRVLVFTAPHTIEVREEPTPTPRSHEVLVETRLSAVSPGTEGLLYRGEIPSHLQNEASVDALSGGLSYPTSYGYACVGHVTETGAAVDASWHGQRVFAFHPHASAFTARPDALLKLPNELSDEAAAFIPNTETAVNLVMDAHPMIGERALVTGQGVVGLITTALLAQHPLDVLVTTDLQEDRRAWSEAFGATTSIDAADESHLREVLGVTQDEAARPADRYEGADLVVELTGAPAALNQALAVAGFDARIVVGSWYGDKQAPLDFGGRFHRSRVSVYASQVSTVRPHLQGRWTKARRMQTVLDVLPPLDLPRLITHRVDLENAQDVYDQLSGNPEGMLQPIIAY